MSTFELAIPVILEHEGGWVDNPKDHGGETNFGISLKMIVHQEHLSPADLGLENFEPGCMRKLTRERAIEVYRAVFWDRHQCYLIADQGAATKYFDALVNFAAPWGIICAQRAAGADVDGMAGPQTFERINAMGPAFEEAFAVTMRARYEEIIFKDATQVEFERGWFMRAACTSRARCVCHPHRAG